MSARLQRSAELELARELEVDVGAVRLVVVVPEVERRRRDLVLVAAATWTSPDAANPVCG
jgi:hypothetical protein